MANRQLVQYIKEQLNHKMSPEQLRNVLLQQGWAGPDIEAAMEAARVETQKGDRRRHHTNHVGLAISGIVVLILLAAILIVVFNQEGTSTQHTPRQPLTPETTEPSLSGWEVCSHEDDSMAKHNCYYDLNSQNVQFDCDKINDETERDYCYRAKEEVLLERYQGVQA
ncbi:hypothetical protein KY327_00500 [Candidatus Woesearchaeota archaeon]|nr:hypothetical protein [Candidatus Woesearchaeota archaeon]